MDTRKVRKLGSAKCASYLRSVGDHTDGAHFRLWVRRGNVWFCFNSRALTRCSVGSGSSWPSAPLAESLRWSRSHSAVGRRNDI